MASTSQGSDEEAAEEGGQPQLQLERVYEEWGKRAKGFCGGFVNKLQWDPFVFIFIFSEKK